MIKNSLAKTMIRNTATAFLFLLLFTANSCIEEFKATTESFESILVVEASITDQDKYHKVLLSRTFRFEEDGAQPEQGASVKVVSGNGEEFVFDEMEQGTYVSSNAFSVQAEVDYTLKITTQDGKSYVSKQERLISGAPISDVKGVLDSDFDGNQGVRVLTETNDTSLNPKFYRYEYVETHKIQSPIFRTRDAVIVSEDPVVVEVIPKTREERICFVTNEPDALVLGSTVGLSENNTIGQPVLFIDKDDIKIKYRYSILVEQYIISREAHTFFSLLKEFSGSESLFSQVQAGFIEGNIISEQNQAEKVIGFFEVASVSSERTFFGFRDFFDGRSQGSFPFTCNVFVAPETDAEIIDVIRNREMKYVDERVSCAPACEEMYGDIEGNGPIIYTRKECVDCTNFGANIVPDFWED